MIELGQLNSITGQDELNSDGTNNHSKELAPELDQEEKLDVLAMLLVEKILADSRIEGLFVNIKDVKSQVENITFPVDKRLVHSRKILKLRDLITFGNKPLELGHKVKFAQPYLNIIKLIYSELEAELGDEFYNEGNDRGLYLSDLQRTARGENITDLLYRFEKFVLVVAFDATPAYMFDDETPESLEKESSERCKNRITALGYELLYILSNIETIRKMNDGTYLSSNLQLFLGFMDSYKYDAYRRTGIGRNLLNQDIYFKSLNELNYILMDLKAALIKGDFVKKTTGNFQFFRNQQLKNEIVSGMSRVEFKDSTEKYSHKLQATITYFSRFKSMSITLYRFRIWIDSDIRPIELKKLKKFFSEVNKKADKANVGFNGYQDFFYFWDKHDEQWFQDIVLILDSDTLLCSSDDEMSSSIRNIREEFEFYASEFLGRRGKVIFENETLPTIEIESRSLMQHLDIPSQLLLNVKDRKGWSIFEKKILPFFVYHDFLDLVDSGVNGVRYSQGRKDITV